MDGFAMGLWKNVRVKWGGLDLPNSTKEQYYWQCKTHLLLTVKDKKVMHNYENGLWIADTINSDIGISVCNLCLMCVS